MPYEISLRKQVKVTDDSIYINDCCWGGDVVQRQFLSMVENQYQNVMANQEDWGWFIWFKQENTNLAIDIHTEDKEGNFKIHVSAQRIRFWGLSVKTVDDTPEVHLLLDRIKRVLDGWAEHFKIARVDRNFRFEV